MRQFHIASVLGLSAMFAALPLTSLPASAQAQDTVGPHSGYCGSWQGGTWTPSGRCTDETTTVTTTTSSTMPSGAAPMRTDGHVPGRVSGTITFVKGHLVTLQQSEQSLVIDDQTALDLHKSGRIANGRSVTAHGYWKDGTFYATAFE